MTAPQVYLVATWYVHWQGIALDSRGWFAVNVVSLDGAAVKQYRKAEHELQVVPVKEILDPDGPGWEQAGEPILAAQFHGIGPHGSAALAVALVALFVSAGVPPSNKDRIVEFVTDLLQATRAKAKPPQLRG